MLTTRVLRGVLLALAGLLASCGAPPVEVNFAGPFPAGAPDLSGFPVRYQGLYELAEDTTTTVRLGPKWLVAQRFQQEKISRHQLDSLGLAPRIGLSQGHDGQPYQVQALAADSFGLRWAQLDTLAHLHGRATLRHYRGWYYLSTPKVENTTWAVQRLAVVGHQLLMQKFNSDSLRIQALDPTTVQRRRENGQLIFTLTPHTGRARRQVSNYGGLWLPDGEYHRK